MPKGRLILRLCSATWWFWLLELYRERVNVPCPQRLTFDSPTALAISPSSPPSPLHPPSLWSPSGRSILRLCSDNFMILTTWAVLWACWGSARSAERLINDTPTALAVSSSSLSPPLHHPSLVVVFGGDWSWDAQTTWWFWLLELYCEMSRGAFLRKTHQWHKLPQPRPFHHHHHRHLCTLHPWWSPSGIRDFHEVHRHMCVNWSAGDRLIEYYQLDWQRQGHVFLDWWQ